MNSHSNGTQIFNLLYQRLSTCGLWNPSTLARRTEHLADCKSSLRQVSNLRCGILAAWLVLFTVNTRAQSYSIDWFSIDGGGGTSTGGLFSVSGTIGQPDAGAMSGGSYSVAGGFWSVVTAVQTPNSPPLSVRRNRTNGTVTVSWPLPATGFLLDQVGALNGSPIPWTQLNPPYQTNATQVFITLPSPAGNRFYRLRKP